jgi:hypothetical protein
VLFGYNYDRVLIKAQASVFPKLILLDKDISNKVVDNKIIFTIVYHKSDYIKSIRIQKFIENKFNHTLGNYKLGVVLKEFDEVDSKDRSHAYYILKGDLQRVRSISKIAKQQRALTFVYELQYLSQEILFSLAMHNRAYIYLNRDAYHSYRVQFVDTLYQIIRFFP